MTTSRRSCLTGLASLATISISLAVSGCGTDNGDGDSATPPVATSTAPGHLVPGAPTANAVAQLTTYRGEPGRVNGHTSVDQATGAEIYDTRLTAVVSRAATVEQVNGALNAINGLLVASIQGTAIVSVEVPSPGGLTANQRAANLLMQSGAFIAAAPVVVPIPAKLPPGAHPTDVNVSPGPLAHLAAAHVIEAWNFLAATGPVGGANVHLIVIDDFGNPIGPSTGHGYGVRNIIDAPFQAKAATALPTGVLQLTPAIDVVNLNTHTLVGDSGDDDIAIAALLKDLIPKYPLGDKFVINRSYTEIPCLGGPAGICPTSPAQDALAKSRAYVWREKMRELFPAFDQNVVVVAAAGNRGELASQASGYNASILDGDLAGARGIQKATPNGLVVEARSIVAGVVPKAGCRFSFPERGVASGYMGSIGAVGLAIQTYVDGYGKLGTVEGTSESTPQVAAVAAWMWRLRPALTASDIVRKLTSTAEATPECPSDAPMLNAAAALLSLDNSIVDAPVRLAMLQPTATPATAQSQIGFTQAQAFLQQIFPTAFGVTAPEQFAASDLNEDSFVDNTKAGKFNLAFDPTVDVGGPVLGAIAAYPNGTAATLNETSLTDFDVLCYYVNSTLYDPRQLDLFKTELSAISARLGRTVTCNSSVPPSSPTAPTTLAISITSATCTVSADDPRVGTLVVTGQTMGDNGTIEFFSADTSRDPEKSCEWSGRYVGSFGGLGPYCWRVAPPDAPIDNWRMTFGATLPLKGVQAIAIGAGGVSVTARSTKDLPCPGTVINP